ncbi:MULTISPECIES: protein kinase domain-containing protein [unclassified Streptomyces]|uniref:serine/threonine-protein kinase n=1 Tax=unclassified Streptomyces TaxID=2593676 RepID=UPI003252A2D8
MPQAGDVLDGRYRLDSQLGAGGFGTVWQGRDLRMNRDVAVKTGVPDTVEDARRFVREAELAGSLAHPNIVTVHDFAHIHWEGRELVYLVMELVRGESLGEVLRRGLPDFHDSVLWAGRICSALEAAHSAGIVHRDIKPANVIIGTADTLKVLDFGIARHQLSRTDLTGNGVIGTALYMAPERFRGAVDARSDLYSLGCLLMELWTGRLPFPGTSWQELYAQHMGAPPPLPSAFAPSLSATADRLVLDLLAKDATGRPPHAAAVAQRLTLLAQEAEHAAPRPSTPPLPPAYTPTVLDEGAEPVRAALRRRLGQITALPDDSDIGELQELLGALIPEAQRELGPDDPLTTEAVLVRARRLWHRDPTDTALARTVPKLRRVFGEQDRRTIEARALLLGHQVQSEHAGTTAATAELREVIKAAQHVLGPFDPVTLHARAELATGLCKGLSRDRFEDVKRRRTILERLLPDLIRGLPAEDGHRRRIHLTVADDAYLMKDYATAGRYYDELAAPGRGDDREWPAKTVFAHAHSLGESGEFERAAAMMAQLRNTLTEEPGNARSYLAAEARRLESRYRRRLRRQTHQPRGWFTRG